MSFKVIVLGCSGGPIENNLSGFLLAPKASSEFIALDAGTLLSSIKRSAEKGHFSDIVLDDPFLTPYGVLFQKHIKAYLISHGHLDHLLGLVINSQDDTCKPIFALDATIDTLRDHIFNYKVWPNFGNEGDNPLSFYEYKRLRPETKVSIPDTECSVEAFDLNHAIGCRSSAFLIEHKGDYVFYFGDTGADPDHEKKRLEEIWRRVAPIVREKKLKGIFLECSYTSDYSGPAVTAHLNTKTIIETLRALQKAANSPIAGLKVIVTHRKGSLKKKTDPQKEIEKEITSNNDLKIDFIFPNQDEKIIL